MEENGKKFNAIKKNFKGEIRNQIEAGKQIAIVFIFIQLEKNHNSKLIQIYKLREEKNKNEREYSILFINKQIGEKIQSEVKGKMLFEELLFQLFQINGENNKITNLFVEQKKGCEKCSIYYKKKELHYFAIQNESGKTHKCFENNENYIIEKNKLIECDGINMMQKYLLFSQLCKKEGKNEQLLAKNQFVTPYISFLGGQIMEIYNKSNVYLKETSQKMINTNTKHTIVSISGLLNLRQTQLSSIKNKKEFLTNYIEMNKIMYIEPVGEIKFQNLFFILTQMLLNNSNTTPEVVVQNLKITKNLPIRIFTPKYEYCKHIVNILNNDRQSISKLFNDVYDVVSLLYLFEKNTEKNFFVEFFWHFIYLLIQVK